MNNYKIRKNKLTCTILTLLLLLIYFVEFTDAQTQEDLNTYAEQLIKNSEFNTIKIRGKIKQEKKGLQQELEKLIIQEQEYTKTLSLKKTIYESLKLKEKQSLHEIKNEHEVLSEIESILQNSAEATLEIINKTAMSRDIDSPREPLVNLAQTNRTPLMEEIRIFADTMMEVISKNGTVSVKAGEYINDQGHVSKGDLIRIGTFTSCFIDQNNHSGFLVSMDKVRSSDNAGLDPKITVSGNATVKPMQLPGHLPRIIGKSIKNYKMGKSNILPVDFMGNAGKLTTTKGKNILDKIKSGGFFVWPIVLAGMIAFIFTVERFVTLAGVKTIPDMILEKLLNLLEHRNIKQAVTVCVHHISFPGIRVIKKFIDQSSYHKDLLDSIMRDEISKELVTLEKHLSILKIIYIICPMLGLLGTVTGMIETFNSISAYGTGDPKLMSGGISEALITTQLGLVVAVPVLVIHHFLDRRIDKIADHMEQTSGLIILQLLKLSKTKGIHDHSDTSH